LQTLDLSTYLYFSILSFYTASVAKAKTEEIPASACNHHISASAFNTQMQFCKYSCVCWQSRYHHFAHPKQMYFVIIRQKTCFCFFIW